MVFIMSNHYSSIKISNKKIESIELFSFGSNFDGQLALDDNVNRNVPTLLMTNDNIISINGKSIKKIKWNSDKYHYLSKQK